MRYVRTRLTSEAISKAIEDGTEPDGSSKNHFTAFYPCRSSILDALDLEKHNTTFVDSEESRTTAKKWIRLKSKASKVQPLFQNWRRCLANTNLRQDHCTVLWSPACASFESAKMAESSLSDDSSC
jgi:hypothetical protein